MRTWWIWPALLLVLGTAGCASSTPAAGPAPRTVRVGVADAGRTVRVHPGDLVEVRLHSTYWSFAPVHGSTLHQDKPVVRAVPIGRTVPGSGAGTITVTFEARHRGTATITAGRRICGEAMRCVGAQGSFRMHVVVG